MRNIIRRGRYDEAVDIYRGFTGTSLTEAQTVISKLEQETDAPFTKGSDSSLSSLVGDDGELRQQDNR